MTNELKQIKDRCNAATSGPWYKQSPCAYGADIYTDEGVRIANSLSVTVGEEQCSLDGEFIAHARTDVPRLLEIIEQANQIIKHNMGSSLEEVIKWRRDNETRG